MKPNLFIVGAPKCGTASWYSYLKSHPDIFFPNVKEPHHFATDLPEKKRIKSRDDYLRLFEGSGSARIVGEASPRYLDSAAAPEHIRKFNPDAKILIFLRDHADYLASWHGYMLYHGANIVPDFAEAWRLSGEPGARPSARGRLRDYRNEARFSPKIERYFAEFPAEQIRVFHFRDWTRNPRATYLEILRFLGVEDDGRTDFPRLNEARQHRTKFLAPIVYNPPKLLVRAAALFKKITGRQQLGLTRLVLRLDSRKGSPVRLDDRLRQEIAEHYEEDRKLVEKRIWSPRD